MSQFLHDDDNENDYAKAITIPWVFSKKKTAELIKCCSPAF